MSRRRSRGRKRITLLEFLHQHYDGKKRKGIDKMALSHAHDVLKNSIIKEIDDIGRSAKVYKISLLHDVLEESEMTPEQIFEALELDEEEQGLLVLLSRNIENPDGSSYIDGIMKDKDAIIIKFADRISNIKDLILWVESDRGFTTTSLKLAERYLKETKEMMDLYLEKYPDGLTNEEFGPIGGQWNSLDNLQKELEGMYNKYCNQAFRED